MPHEELDSRGATTLIHIYFYYVVVKLPIVKGEISLNLGI